jgi:hypothetical protein
MTIREFSPKDLKDIEAMHGNPAYQMPDLEHPLMLVKKVMADEHDEARMAVFGRLFISALIFVDHSWLTPRQRLDALTMLQAAAMDDARARGLDIAATQMEGRFAERMQEMGWVKAWGEMYLHDI